VDQRSDIYSLGIILYEMVTGQVPFEAETPLAIILKHLSDPLPPPSLIKKDISQTLEQVILKALAKDPDDRFATAAEFLGAWKRALDEQRERETAQRVSEAIPSSTPSVRTPVADARQRTPSTATMTKPARTTGWVAGCLILACIALTIGGGGILLASNWGTLSPATATFFPTLTNVPPPSETPIPIDFGNVLLEDDFSNSNRGWGTGTDTDSSVEYANDGLQVLVFKTNYLTWSTPNATDYQNIHVEVTAIHNDTNPYTAFGVICNELENTASFYYFVITPSGQYAIAKAEVGQTDFFFTNDDQWGSSDLIPRNAASYRIGANCGNGTLTLYVDGQQIDSVSDSTYTTGRVGLITWSSDEAPSADIVFDDFEVTSLP
jgi:hypothetical protein